MKKIIVGSRGSKLALKYAELAINEIKKITDVYIEHKKINTTGDLILDKRTSEIGGKGEFIKNIEKELLNENIDIAVHSLKDMPSLETEGLKLNCFLKRNNPQDVLISKNNFKLEELKKNSIVGTSSLRREFQTKHIRPDLKFKLIRGNIDTRIRKLENEDYDAIILARAGLEVLSFKEKITEIFDCENVIPSAGQGIIALQSRINDLEINNILKKINHHQTSIEANVERNVLKFIDGDCNTAVGIYSNIKNNKVGVVAELFSIDGKRKYKCSLEGLVSDAEGIASKVGKNLKDQIEKKKL
jgi:hydroxymethylbilane synthase